MKEMFYKLLRLIAKIGFAYALILVNVVSGRHIYEMKEPSELMKYKK